MNDLKELRKNYDNVCEEYLKQFCQNFDRMYEEDSWVAGEAGTIACVGDYFFDFNDVIKYCVDNNLTDFNDLMEWNDYCLSAAALDLDSPNYRSWHKGCPRIPQEKLDELINMKAELIEEVDNLKNIQSGLY